MLRKYKTLAFCMKDNKAVELVNPVTTPGNGRSTGPQTGHATKIIKGKCPLCKCELTINVLKATTPTVVPRPSRRDVMMARSHEVTV